MWESFHIVLILSIGLGGIQYQTGSIRIGSTGIESKWVPWANRVRMLTGAASE